MTCQSCVKSIESTIGTKPGVKRIKVVLAEHAGYIDYDASVTDVQTLAADIEDMGFECSFAAATTTNGIGAKMGGSSRTSTVRIRIVGMTCQSCVRSIESKVGERAGVLSIRVDLAAEEAKVELDGDAVTAQQVSDMIDDMGFEASVKDGGSDEKTRNGRGECVYFIK